VANFLAQVLASVTVSTTLSVLLVWLTKTWISERFRSSIKGEYDQKLETHKAQLKAQSDVEIEKLRSQLSISTAEHQVRFANLHEKRAEVIATTYSLLRELFNKLRDYIKIYETDRDQPKEQRREVTIEAIKAFRDYVEPNIIFFPVNTAEKLDNIDSQLVNAFNEFVIKVERGRDAGDNWLGIVKRVGTEIPPAMRELETEFRRILGGSESVAATVDRRPTQ
jgi:hypothetical protein